MLFRSNAIGVGGLPGILSIHPESMLNFFICTIIAIIIPFILTIIVGKKKLTEIERNGISKKVVDVDTEKVEVNQKETENISKNLKSFLLGKVISLKEVNDGVFSEGMMGEGIAIIPENEILYSPADAEIAVLMDDSKHACGLRLANGMEILLHIGLDTVDMNGDGFQYFVTQGQMVKAGEPLIKFDREKIKAAGHKDVTICAITEAGNAKNIQFTTGINVSDKETTLITFE